MTLDSTLSLLALRLDMKTEQKEKFCHILFSLLFHPQEEVSYPFSEDPVFILQTHIYHVFISFLIYERYAQQLHVSLLCY